jgi:hypothetical protein
MIRRSIVGGVCASVLGITLLGGCDGGSTGPTPEAHDQKGEHLNYPAAGANSPDYKKDASKGGAKAPKK